MWRPSAFRGRDGFDGVAPGVGKGWFAVLGPGGTPSEARQGRVGACKTVVAHIQWTLDERSSRQTESQTRLARVRRPAALRPRFESHSYGGVGGGDQLVDPSI